MNFLLLTLLIYLLTQKVTVVRIILLTVYTMLSGGIFAQVLRQPLSVRYAGLGAYSRQFADVFSATSNQASLANLPNGAMAVYGERRFMMEELNGYAAIAALPLASYGTVGVQADYFGSSSGFNESQLGIIYARKITRQMDVGFKVNYHNARVPGYGSAGAVNVEGGVLIHLTDQLHTGIHVYNPTRVTLGKGGTERLASIYRFGLGYDVSDKVFLSTEVVKQENQQLGVNAGFQYNIHERLFIRAGVATASDNSFVSLGLKLDFARVDINTTYHPQLGFSPGLMLLFNLKKAKRQ